jgi:pilus assembly protein CpaB
LKRANKLMLIAGVILAAVSFVAVVAFGSLNGAPQAPVSQDVNVVVAAHDLALGTALTADAVTTITRPETEAADTYRQPEDVIGQIVRRPVTQGQALTTADFQTGANAPDIARALGAGLVAVAIPLSRVDSVGNLLQPGDYVDVLLSLDDPDGLNPIVQPNPNYGHTSVDGTQEQPYFPLDDFLNNTTIKVVVQNVQVLAALPPVTADPNNPQPQTNTVEPEVIAILAVTAQQSEVIRFAQLDGHVSLALRSPADTAAAPVDTTGITLKELVDRWGVLPPQPVTAP